MKIHTLGPVGTDSYQAAQHYQTDEEIVLHSSFEEVLTNLAAYRGDQVLLPVAFRSNQIQNLNFANFNYNNWDKVKIHTTFVLDLMPLIVLENTKYQRPIATLHAATETLMREYLAQVGLDNIRGPELIFAPSKPEAFRRFRIEQDWFTIVSAQQYEKSDLADDDRYQVRQTLRPEMVWVLYDIL
ncbi:hypothetical protein [Eupransor demetentiae]|uniref:Uncharacterized protein n=1 Tax=Eupransor demetentiae TaxID=3109584 RepID=A0ABM9N3V6_9LACO|nr:hypothetical protein R54876_GBNLAHCA_00386 [Lactobacillaceae bacterium LMG 33000]